MRTDGPNPSVLGEHSCQRIVFPHMKTIFESSTLFGYLDAGSGSLLIQSAIAGILTLGVALRSKWSMIVATIQAKKKH